MWRPASSVPPPPHHQQRPHRADLGRSHRPAPTHPHRPHQRGDRRGLEPGWHRVLTTSNDGTARIWDVTTGQLVGWQLGQLPDSELAVWSSPEHELLGASDGAWRWLGWLVPQDGRLVRLPAETWGPLAPLDPLAPAPLCPPRPEVDDRERGPTPHGRYSHTSNSEKAQVAVLDLRVGGPNASAYEPRSAG